MGYRLIQGMPIDDTGALDYGDNLLSRHVCQHLDLPAWPPAVQARDRCRGTQAEV
jgi:hypothetical protein